MPVSDTRLLYTLAELQALDAAKSPDIAKGAYGRALDWVREGIMSFDVLSDELSEYLVPEHFGKAGITCAADKIEYDLDRGYFALPANTSVKVPLFLAALKAYYDGRDYRGPEYAGAERHLLAPDSRRHAVDLRSHDARLAGEMGLYIDAVTTGYGYYSHRNGFTWYTDSEPGFSETFEQDCEEFLCALCEEARQVLQGEWEYQETDENVLETAEANDWLFDHEGKPARRA